MKFLPVIVIALAHLRVASALPANVTTEVATKGETKGETEGETDLGAETIPLPPCPNLIYNTAFCCTQGTLGLYQGCSSPLLPLSTILFKTQCALAGKEAVCCVAPLLGNDLVACTAPPLLL
ncbi:hypothetical protein ANO14919_074390 [Xylariales sp. No.14919]|nr:hypothetical protein ANO14919_074390 [Xylariales sp. No.14919]